VLTQYKGILVVLCSLFQVRGAFFSGRGKTDQKSPLPEFIDPVFMKTSPKRSFSLNRKRAFWLVFAKTGSIISGTGLSERFVIFSSANAELHSAYRVRAVLTPVF
jgi:hypothetical protein